MKTTIDPQRINNLFVLYLEGFIQKLEKEGKVTLRECAAVRGYMVLINTPRFQPLLNEFIEYVRSHSPDEVDLNGADRENNAKTHP